MSRVRMTMAAVLGVSMVMSLAWAARAHAKDDRQEAVDRLQKAQKVYEELVNAPDRGVPDQLLKNCKAIAIFPSVIKAAVGVGARHGHGVLLTRGSDGSWSPPAFMSLTGGSWGLQLGATSTDVVMFFMTDNSVNSLLSSKFQLSAKAGAAAGPVGRTAEAGTDLKLNSQILTYARSKGLFAGISLEGAKVSFDKEDTAEFYGKSIGARTILMDRNVPADHSAEYESLQHAMPS